jgi:hypothetical protein
MMQACPAIFNYLRISVRSLNVVVRIPGDANSRSLADDASYYKQENVVQGQLRGRSVALGRRQMVAPLQYTLEARWRSYAESGGTQVRVNVCWDNDF